jgi:ribonucleoside-diphosphate reductase alpha chain
MMKRIEQGGDWTLFSPDETPELHHIYGKEFEARYAYYEEQAKAGNIRLFKTMKAADLWRKILSMLFETGHPWITFKDPSNLRSPQDHVGVIHHSNLCTEIMLNTSADETAVCNLGSVNIPRHLVDGRLDTRLLESTVTTAMRMLDNVVDVNFYPTPEAKYANMRHRPVGLGVMGLQDALFEMGVNFDSQSAVDFSDELMEQISYFAILGSSRLAKERGAYSTFPGSKWDRGLLPIDTIAILEEHRGEKIDVDRRMRMDWQLIRDHIAQWGMRNSNTMAIAPTATISNIAGSYPSIEPIYKNVYVKSNMSGEFIIVNAYLVDALKAEKLWSQEMLNEIKRHEGDISDIDAIPKDIRETYKETFGIDSEWLIRAAAVRGKWIDQSQSLNIFVKGSSGKRLSEIYMYAWKMGLKTTYYLRSLAATSIEQSGIGLSQSNALDAANASLSANASVVGLEPVSEGLVAPVETIGFAEEAMGFVAAPVATSEQPLATSPEVMTKSVGAAVMSETANSQQPTANSGIATSQQPQAISDQTQVKIFGASDAVNEDGVKLCLIDDPDCEACQ